MAYAMEYQRTVLDRMREKRELKDQASGSKQHVRAGEGEDHQEGGHLEICDIHGATICRPVMHAAQEVVLQPASIFTCPLAETSSDFAPSLLATQQRYKNPEFICTCPKSAA